MATLQSTTIGGSTVWDGGIYPQLIATYELNGDFAANTWHQVGNWRINNGIVYLVAYADTYGAGGDIYRSTLTFDAGSVFPISTITTNSSYVENFGTSIGAGHAPNTERWQARIRHLGGNPPVSPILEFLTSRNLTGINGTASRTVRFQIYRVGPT